MKFKDIQPSVIELPPGQQLFRVQRTRALLHSVRLNGITLPPTGMQTGRFCLPDEPTAYLADSELTALYESLFRREVHSRNLSELATRSMLEFTTRKTIRLADLRPLAEPYPFLQAQRIAVTQAFAQECRAHLLDGILYSSAQHPQHTCVALFASGIAPLRKVTAQPLMQPGTRRLLGCVVDAARRSGVPVLDDMSA